jgi:large subunit ribosomal protein L25
MTEVALQAETRAERGSTHARRLRGSGRVPATLYGRGIDPLSLTVDARELAGALHTDAGMNVLIDLKLDGDTHLAMARQLERHPVKGSIIHVDFLKIARDQKVTVDVPLAFEGDAIGVKEGGQIDHHLWNVSLECLVTAVPEKIVMDITNLNVGDILRVSDLEVPAGVEILTGADEVVIGCITPTEMKVEAELEPGEEPAVVGEEPAEGEGGAADDEQSAEG